MVAAGQLLHQKVAMRHPAAAGGAALDLTVDQVVRLAVLVAARLAALGGMEHHRPEVEAVQAQQVRKALLLGLAGREVDEVRLDQMVVQLQVQTRLHMEVAVAQQGDT